MQARKTIDRKKRRLEKPKVETVSQRLKALSLLISPLTMKRKLLKNISCECSILVVTKLKHI
jgi:hypothetical protein